MALKRIEKVPHELPHARVYLDDIEEISSILQEAVSGAEQDFGQPSGPAPHEPREPPAIRYEFRGTLADSVDDLRSLGGSTTEFVLRVGPSVGATLRFYRLLNPEVNLYCFRSDQAWAVYGRIRSIFERRQLRIKNTILELPGFLKILLWLIVSLVLPAVLGALAPRSALGVWILAAYAAFALTAIVHIFFGSSRVCFVSSQDKAKTSSASRRQTLRDVLMLVIGGLVTALAGFVIRHFFK